MKDAQGNVIGALSAAQDITERMMAEQALREKEQLLSTFIEHSPIYTFIKKVTPNESRVMVVSENYRDMIGIPASEMVGKTMQEMFPAELAAKMTDDDWNVVSSGKMRELDEELNNRNYSTTKFPIDIGEDRLLAGYTIDVTERKQAEKQIRESEERFRSLYENSTLGLYRTTPQGKILLANPTLIKLLGYKSFEEISGRNLEEQGFEPAYDRARFVKTMETDGAIKGWESAWKRSDGTIIYVRESAVAVRDEHGTALYYDGTVEDISEASKAQEQARKSDMRFRLIAEDAGEWIWEVDANGLYTYSSPAVQEILGYAPDELVGKKHFYDLYAPDVRERLKQSAFAGFAKKLITKKLINHNLHKNGKTVALETNGSPIVDEKGDMVGYRGADTDITERQQNEEALIRDEAKFRSTFDQSPVGSVIVGLDKRFIRCNPSFCNFVGYAEIELIGKTIADITYPEDVELGMKEMKQLVQGEITFCTLQKRYLHKDGSFVWGEISISLVREATGKPLYFIPIIQDITERKRAEAENRRLREKAEISSRLAAVGEMAAGIAHEINNPLTGVVGYSELLMEKEGLPEDVKEGLTIINDGSKRVKDIIRRMLTFARQVKPMRTNSSINELIEATVSLRTYVLRTANIEVIKHLEHDLPWITVDPGQMQQVFLNLLVNAEYAMKKAHGKGTLIITTEKTGDHIRISFKDDGTGMDKVTKEKLFNPFFTTKDVGEGTGLGLGLSRSIILEHGGTIEVESEVGQGANFIITLPITSTPEETTARDSSSAPVLTVKVKSARILVIDDEMPIQKLVSAILTRSGHVVDVTGDHKEALSNLERTSYDIVLMDIRMPGMSGMELYELVIKSHPELKNKFIFITGDTSDVTTSVFLEQNNLSYISKPFDTDTLRNKVNSLL